MKKSIFTGVLLFFVQNLFAQVYIQNQTRHRFAQLTIGYDYISSIGGQSYFLGNDGLEQFDLNNRQSHRLIVGGTHFWGHADFYFAVYSLATTNGINSTDNYFSSHNNGFETVFKYYPFQIKHHKIRPFIGTGVVPYRYRQNDRSLEFGRGESIARYNFPLIGGFTYNLGNHLFNLTAFYNYSNKFDYHVSRTQTVSVRTPPLYVSLGYKYSLDASKILEKGWLTGETQNVTERLRKEKKLDGIFLGAGVSTAYGLGTSSYNTGNRPYLTGAFDGSFMADLSLGYFFSKPEISINANWRKYRSGISAYGTVQRARRNSISFELSHGFMDFHGFVPFIGPVISYEQLNVSELHEGTEIFDISENKVTVGLLFGWDIKLTHKEWWHLRTNLRYFPFLKIKVEDNKAISLNNLEFNFIQAIIYPGRIRKKRS